MRRPCARIVPQPRPSSAPDDARALGRVRTCYARHEVLVSTTRLYSIGHSNHSIERFLHLLELHRIEALIDVRSVPYSRFSPQFSIHALRTAISEAGRAYVFLGKELGGRPEGREFYDEDGHVLYGRRAVAPDFQGGLDQLIAQAE